jgi:hypothetical protein
MDENETEFARRKRLAKEDANWQDIADVDWTDLEHFLDVARRTKSENAFNTAIRVLTAIRNQILHK